MLCCCVCWVRCRYGLPADVFSFGVLAEAPGRFGRVHRLSESHAFSLAAGPAQVQEFGARLGEVAVRTNLPTQARCMVARPEGLLGAVAVSDRHASAALWKRSQGGRGHRARLTRGDAAEAGETVVNLKAAAALGAGALSAN